MHTISPPQLRTPNCSSKTVQVCIRKHHVYVDPCTSNPCCSRINSMREQKPPVCHSRQCWVLSQTHPALFVLADHAGAILSTAVTSSAIVYTHASKNQVLMPDFPLHTLSCSFLPGFSFRKPFQTHTYASPSHPFHEVLSHLG